MKKCIYRYHWFKYLCACSFHLSAKFILLTCFDYVKYINFELKLLLTSNLDKE